MKLNRFSKPGPPQSWTHPEVPPPLHTHSEYAAGLAQLQLAVCQQGQ